MGSDEDCGDGKEIVGEIVVLSFMFTVNHEFSASLCKDKLQEVAANSRKSVTVHDGNFIDQSLEDLFHQGLQTLSVEVDPRANVVDDDVSRERFLEVFDLSVEVSLLLGGADPGVDVRLLFGGGGVLAEHTQDTID